MNYVHPRVWLVVFVLFSVLFVLNIQFKDTIKTYFNNQRIDYIFKTQAKNKGDVKVLLLCSSLGKQGISDSDELNQLMAEIDSSRFEFVKVSIRTASLTTDFIENQSLYERIIDYDPDYIVFQESYLFIDRIEDVTTVSLRNTINAQNILELIGVKSTIQEALKNIETTSVYEDSTLNNSPFLSRRIQIRDEACLNIFTKDLRATILVLELPLPGYFEDVMDSIRQTRSYQEIYNAEKEKTDFIYLAFPKRLPFAYYYDASHMNDFGERVYTSWFLKTLSNIHNQ